MRRRPASSGNARPRLHQYATSYDVDPAQLGGSRWSCGDGWVWRGSLLVGLVEELCLRRDRVGGSRWEWNRDLKVLYSLVELLDQLINGIDMSLWRNRIIPSASHPSAGARRSLLNRSRHYSIGSINAQSALLRNSLLNALPIGAEFCLDPSSLPHVLPSLPVIILRDCFCLSPLPHVRACAHPRTSASLSSGTSMHQLHIPTIRVPPPPSSSTPSPRVTSICNQVHQPFQRILELNHRT